MREYDHHLFYSNDAVDNDMVALDESETRHAVSVLRINVGEQLQVTGGNGVIYDCECVDIHKRSMSCGIVKKTIVPKITPELTLLVGLPDRERFETVVEYATALGVSRIVPLVMDHCRKPWWESWEKSSDRFRAKMIVSMKQCLYPYMPTLDAPTSLRRVIDTCDGPIITADQNGETSLTNNIVRHTKLNCLVGPPGGLSADESNTLESRGSITVNIAPTRLRTELAAAVLCARIIGIGWNT